MNVEEEVKGEKELKYWIGVYACDMSDEEENDDVFVRHTPSYRSNLLNNFIKKLDDRCEKANSSHPRKE